MQNSETEKKKVITFTKGSDGLYLVREEMQDQNLDQKRKKKKKNQDSLFRQPPNVIGKCPI